MDDGFIERETRINHIMWVRGVQLQAIIKT